MSLHLPLPPGCHHLELLVMYVVCGFVIANDLNVCIVGP